MGGIRISLARSLSCSLSLSRSQLDLELDRSVKAAHKERALGREEEEREVVSGPTGPWLKKAARLKLDYNKHSDYASLFLTKFKTEFVQLNKVLSLKRALRAP